MLDNYPPGAANDPSAPYNQVDVSEKDFDVTCVQCLSKTVTVATNDYIPGASGVDYEPDGEGGYCACGWQDPDNTSDTNWSKEYQYDHYTPLQLIQILKEKVMKELETLENTPVDEKSHGSKVFEVRKLKHLIEDCDDWCEDETEFEEG